MKITAVIARLESLLQARGDIDCVFDCPHCNTSTIVGKIVVGPPVAALKGESTNA